MEIERKPLLNRWIAEGSVANGDMTSRTLEEVAESYFYELISRSMIQPSKLSALGNVRTCRIHDIVRDIALSISRAENLIFIVEEHTSTRASTKQSLRHLSRFAEKYLDTGLVLSGVRSLTLFNSNSALLASFCLSRFKMLRVLDLRYRYGTFKQRKQDSNIIGSLIHLRYLHFPLNQFYALPRSIGNLKGLQTLELRLSSSSILPKEITKLQNLRNLSVHGFTLSDLCFDIYDYRECLTSVPCPPCSFGDNMCCCCYRNSDNNGCVRVPEGIRWLKDLQILKSVNIRRSSGKAIKELGELTQLRTLFVKGVNVWDKKCQIFSVALEKLSSLRSLCVFGDRDTLNKLISISSPHPFLERLVLDGHLGKIPAWIGQSVNLIKITLRSSEVKELEALAELPNLTFLRLYSSAYSGERVVFRGFSFPKLKYLGLIDSSYLREVTFEEGTLPNMEGINICYIKLTVSLNGIKNLKKLNEISLADCILARKDTLQREVDTHPNHPVLRMMRVTTIGPAITDEEHEVDAVESLSETGESSCNLDDEVTEQPIHQACTDESEVTMWKPSKPQGISKPRQSLQSATAQIIQMPLFHYTTPPILSRPLLLLPLTAISSSSTTSGTSPSRLRTASASSPCYQTREPR